MDLKKLLGLRPKDETPDAIRSAMANAEAARVEAVRRAAELEASRARTLLDGSATEVARAETELATARADAERAQAMLAGLRERLAVAEEREIANNLRRVVAEAEETKAAFLGFLRADYPRLAAQIADGLRLEEKAAEAGEHAMTLFEKLPPHVRDKLMADGVRPPAAPCEHLHNSFQRPRGFGGFVCLPSPNGPPRPLSDERAIWS